MVYMGNIYAFGPQENLRQDAYLTQGVNETYSAFICRVSGFQVNFGEPDRLLRYASSESSNSSQSSFKDCLGYVSTAPECYYISGNEEFAKRYYFHMRTETLKKSSSQNKNLELQTVTKQPKMQARELGASFMKNKTTFISLLRFIGQCFMSCRNVKK